MPVLRSGAFLLVVITLGATVAIEFAFLMFFSNAADKGACARVTTHKPDAPPIPNEWLAPKSDNGERCADGMPGRYF